MRIHFFAFSHSFAQGQGDSFVSGLLQPGGAVAAWENARRASLEKAPERFLRLRTAFQELFLKVSDGAVTEVHREESLNQLFFSLSAFGTNPDSPSCSVPLLLFLCSRGGIKPYFQNWGFLAAEVFLSHVLISHPGWL